MSYKLNRRRSSSKRIKAGSVDITLGVADLPVLKRKRTLALNRLKKTLEVAKEALVDTSLLNSFLAHFTEVQKLRSKFEEAHEDILSIIDDPSEESEDALRVTFDEVFFEVVAIHRKLTLQDGDRHNDSFQSTSNSASLKVKLPKINIPTFSGNIKAWPEFFDVFSSLIHDNSGLTDTERMHYMISSLSGDALGLVKTFPVQGSFYQEAFKTLVTRYRDKRELAFTCWKEMLTVTLKPNSPHDFRRVLDMFHENLTILKGVGLPTEQWDFVLCYLLLSKLDSKTRYEYEQSHPSVELPRYVDLKEFLHSKCEALVRDSHFANNDRSAATRDSSNTVTSNVSKKASAFVVTKNDAGKRTSEPVQKPSQDKRNSVPSSSIVLTPKCSFCDQPHTVSQCEEFLKKTTDERINYAMSHRWCFNCLRPSHSLRDCKSIFRCRDCSQRHHTLLHRPAPVEEELTKPETTNPSTSVQVDSVLANLGESSTVLLSTAQIDIRDSTGKYQSFRALIDSGSQAHFITDRAVERLGLHRTQTTRKIRGLGQSKASVSGSVKLEVGFNGKTFIYIDALSLPNICGDMPCTRLNPMSWRHLQHLTLADPNCYEPGPIDILLGAEVFSSLLLPGNISGSSNEPSAMNSVFGWLLLGNVGCDSDNISSFFVSFEEDLLHQEVQKFWELENIPESPHSSPEDNLCEQFYTKTVSRDTTGRYVVALPFKDGKEYAFVGSREIALRRFHSLERSLSKRSQLREQYVAFMDDYLQSGHMSRVPTIDLCKGKYYIPHHCVLRPESVTTKLRVVFDASAQDSTNTSLNDRMLTGPKLQANIMALLLKFRVHFVVFTADMRQMYRQISVRDSDRDFQRIFWRSDTTYPVQEYRLNTVTYGVSSAPFLACRTIRQLVADEGHDFPLASQILSSDVYVDDIVSGSGTISEVQQMKKETVTLLSRGHLELRKWASNKPELLADLPSEHCLTDFLSMDIGKTMDVKILGLRWDPVQDVFTFEVTPLKVNCTKRTILSELARIFDPLGFLAPLTFVAKVLVQKLWLLGIDWDASPPSEIVSRWEHYLSQLSCLMQLKIPRCTSVANAVDFQLHGFADASEAGYGAVVYLRIQDNQGVVRISLLCAKSRVAPVKCISLPRLELCGAVLLSDLMQFTIQTYRSLLVFSDIFAWSDSTVVLAWLHSHPSRWKTFVSNRVSHIQTTIPEARWNHVGTADNPADIPSRGMNAADLINNSLWWSGPSWLTLSSDSWPSAQPTDYTTKDQCEERIQSLVTQETCHALDTLLEKFSSIRRIQRILGYCVRFIENTRCHDRQLRKTHRFLARSELEAALTSLVKHVQAQHFQSDIDRLMENLPLPRQLRKLSPFLDEQGVLRVGGRLSRSGLEFEHKHPALLPRESRLSYLIIEAIHLESCHAGVNTMHCLIVQQFWILSVKRAIRHCLSKCIRCYRVNPAPLEPYMSDLPKVRVNQAKPFSIVGVDYGGPFSIKSGRHRGAKISKAYLCLFVCFTTKALHLELASDLSTEAFIAALRRFVGRRGRVSIIHSDRGTNFVGAKSVFDSYMRDASETEQIEFRFNPPSSPHWGGIWEIQIKVVKSHLYRIIGNQCLTFEELTTLFVQIEAMLNSRPLCPMSSDPNDISALTPGHFLTLEPLTAPPDANVTTVNINRLNRWQLIQRFQQDFWKRWKAEYLHTLTQRAKWTQHCKPLREGSIVIIKNENYHPLSWPLARVLTLHPAADGVVRCATVRTPQSTLVRPLIKLCPLPNQCDDNN